MILLPVGWTGTVAGTWHISRRDPEYRIGRWRPLSLPGTGWRDPSHLLTQVLWLRLSKPLGTKTGIGGVPDLWMNQGSSVPEQGAHFVVASFAFCLPIAGSPEGFGWFIMENDGIHSQLSLWRLVKILDHDPADLEVNASSQTSGPGPSMAAFTITDIQYHYYLQSQGFNFSAGGRGW